MRAMRLRGKTFVVVGGTSGIGAALVPELARRGAVLRLFGRRAEALAAQAERVRALGGAVSTAVGDTRDPEAVRAALGVFHRDGPIDGLVFVAGISRVSFPRELTAAEAREVYETNLFGFLHWVEALLPGMLDRRAGLVAAATAQCAWRGIPCGEAYASSKAALQSYLESMRLDCAPYGVEVVELIPGFVKTPMSDLNNFTQPFMIGPERAARIVADGLEAGAARIPFGPGMTWLMRLLRLLPDAWYAAVFAGLTRGRHDTERMLARLPPLACPTHGPGLVFDRYRAFACPRCAHAVTFARDHVDLLDALGEAGPGGSGKIMAAYAVYAAVYPVAAYLAMKLVWKGSLRKLVRFYARQLAAGAREARPVLDVATGDGSLLALALRAAGAEPDLLCVDLSRDMLEKASGRLAKYRRKLLLRADAGALALPDGWFERVLCFGGFHVFAEPGKVFGELARVLAPGGVLAGSILTRPPDPAAAAWAERFIGWGSLANSMEPEEVEAVLAGAGLALTSKEWNGAMLLFEARRA